MSLRVAFDLDGTLADMERVLRQEAARLFGLPSPAPGESTNGSSREAASPGMRAGQPPRAADSADMPATDEDAARGERAADAPRPPNADLTERQWARLWAHVRRTEDFWLSLPEIDEGIVEHIATVAARRRWDVLFITTRPRVRGQTTQLQSQKWLQTHGFPIPSVYVVQRSRGLIAQALELDAVVDDRLENCVDVALESKAVPILIRPSAARTVAHESRPVGVRVVPSIRDAIAVLEKLDDERRQPGVIRSIRKWLGR